MKSAKKLRGGKNASESSRGRGGSTRGGGGRGGGGRGKTATPKVKEVAMAAADAGVVHEEEPIPTPDSVGSLFEAIKTLHARTDQKIDEKFGNLDRGVRQELQEIRSNQDDINATVGAIAERVRDLENGSGDKERLLNEIRNSEKKIFIRSPNTLTQHQFNALIEASSITLSAWQPLPRAGQEYRYIGTFWSHEDRERLMYTSQRSVESENNIKLKRDVPLSYKKGYRELEDAGAAYKKATKMTNNEGQLTNTISTKITFEGLKAVLKVRNKEQGAQWETWQVKGPDPPRQQSSRQSSRTLSEMSRTAILHGNFSEDQIKNHISTLARESWESVGVEGIVPGNQCTKIICRNSEAAAKVARSLNGKQIPGGQNNNTYSCHHIAPATPTAATSAAAQASTGAAAMNIG